MKIPEFVVSQRFHHSGEWIVHQPGGNRPHKIAYFETREEAESVARRLNEFLSQFDEVPHEPTRP